MENNNVFSKIFDWVKAHVAILSIIVAVLVVGILLITILPGGPKKTVKKYVKALDNKNAAKYVKIVDHVGKKAWQSSYFIIKDFDEDDYEKFIEEYKDIDKDDFDEEYMEEQEEKMEDSFDQIDDDYKKYNVKLEKIKKVEKLGKDLYAIKAKVSIYAVHEDKDEDEIDETSTITFVVYKNKIISAGI